MKTIWIRSFCVAAALVFGALAPRVVGEELGAVKQRMAQRLAEVDALKDRGAIGENNRGFLEARATLSSGESGLVAAENSDRGEVYAAVAQRTGSTPEHVGRARAKRIAENSRPGVWLQDEGGRWYKK